MISEVTRGCLSFDITEMSENVFQYNVKEMFT